MFNEAHNGQHQEKTMTQATTTTTTTTTTRATRAEWRVPALAAGTSRHRAVYGLPEKTISANWPIIGQSLKASVWDAYLYNGTHNSALRDAAKSGTDEFFVAFHGTKAKTAQSKGIKAVLAALDAANVKAGSCSQEASYAAAMQVIDDAWLAALPKKVEVKKTNKKADTLADAIGLVLAEAAAGKIPAADLQRLRAALAA